MKTNKKKFPKWESREVIIKPMQLEYKYVIIDDQGNCKWEKGGNRKVDLRDVPSHKTVVIEDQQWNKVSLAHDVRVLSVKSEMTNFDQKLESKGYRQHESGFDFFAPKMTHIEIKNRYLDETSERIQRLLGFKYQPVETLSTEEADAELEELSDDYLTSYDDSKQVYVDQMMTEVTKNPKIPAKVPVLNMIFNIQRKLLSVVPEESKESSRTNKTDFPSVAISITDGESVQSKQEVSTVSETGSEKLSFIVEEKTTWSVKTPNSIKTRRSDDKKSFLERANEIKTRIALQNSQLALNQQENSN